jgi:nicotinate phosphoribosyltransferase
MHETAVFEGIVRDPPPGRGYLVASGLEQVLSFFESARFTASAFDWL